MKRRIAVLGGRWTRKPDEDELDWHDEADDARRDSELGNDVASSLPSIRPLRGDAYRASLVVWLPGALCVHLQRRH